MLLLLCFALWMFPYRKTFLPTLFLHFQCFVYFPKRPIKLNLLLDLLCCFQRIFFLSEHLQMGEKMMIYLIHNVILLELVKSIGSLCMLPYRWLHTVPCYSNPKTQKCLQERKSRWIDHRCKALRSQRVKAGEKQV